MSLPLRYHLALVLVGLNLLVTGAVAGFAYRTSHQSLEQQAWQAVGAVADARQQALVESLERRQERMNAFLASVESLCGEQGPSGHFGWQTGCVRVALLGWRDAERATGAELRYRTRRLMARGSWRKTVDFPAGQLAAMTGADGGTEFVMRAVRGDLTLRGRFSLADLDPIFQDRSGLKENGEVLLADSRGQVLTPTRYPQPPAGGLPAASDPVQQCLAGVSGEMLARDYRGVPVISGVRPMPALGGGCVVANLQYSDALVPIQRFARAFGYASAGSILIAIALSFMISHAVAKPIARLASSARAMQQGRFDQPVLDRGPSEIRQLERAFSETARSIGDLVQREHAARVDAEAANRLKDDFLATLSHELRTPLNAILGWVSILLHGSRVDEARTVHAIQAIDRNARMQARLVEDLLDVSRITSGQMRLNLSAVWLHTVVEAAVEAVRPAADAKALELVKRLDTSTRPIKGDPQRLQQVVWNLLSNAVRFTPEHGRVEVALREVDGRAEIQVADTGIGIGPDFVPHVFERFRQADSSSTRAHGGLGLGLAIVQHLVELHGGTVTAGSAGEGGGATFTVRLPMRAELPAVLPQAEPAGTRELGITLHGARVLVVDDDPDAREVLRAMLEEAGATVATTASAAETRAVMGHVHPDLLIADIGMPGEDGYSLIRSVRALEPNRGAHVPAIALTAHARTEDVARALTAGFEIHVAKPVDPADLLSTIAMLVQPQSAS